MIKTCKELAEILLQHPDQPVKVSIDDGFGMQCDAEIEEVQVLDGGTISIIPVQPEIYD